MDYTNDGSTDKTSFSDDNENILFWRENYLPNGVLAGCLPYGSGGEIDGFDICFSLTWPIVWTSTGEVDEFDVRNAATHEIGHTFILNDLYDSSNSAQTMYGHTEEGETKKRTLATGDKWGAQHIYPAASVPSVSITEPDPYETVSGYVTITATASGGTISSVKYKATDTGFYYDSGWNTMTEVGGSYTATWDARLRFGYHYITVQAIKTTGYYGWDWVYVYVVQD